MIEASKYKVVLLDIEGTTTSISFAFDVLFPYARKHMPAYVENNIDNEDLRTDIRDLVLMASKEEAKKGFSRASIDYLESKSGDKNTLIRETVEYVLMCMDEDR
eukprot:Platyproteum_vivax@DN3618_c0_g1_i2.p1